MDNMNYFQAIKFLSKYIFKYKKNFLMFYFGWLFDSVLIVISPILFGIMIDEIVYYQNINNFIQIAIIFFLLTFFSCILYFLIYFQHSYLMNMYTFEIRMEIFELFLNCDAQVLSNIFAGDVITNIQDYSEECMHFVIRNIIHTVNRTIMMLLYAFGLLVINWKIGLFLLLFAPISIYVNAKFGQYLKKQSKEESTRYTGYIGWVFEILSAFREIRMMKSETFVKEQFQNRHNEIFAANVKAGFAKVSSGNIISLLNLIFKICILMLVAFASKNNGITVGNITVILSFYGSFTTTIRNICDYFLEAQKRIPIIQRIFDFFELPCENWDGKDEMVISSARISFINVSFGFEGDKNLFDSLSFEIAPGERVAIVGESGCGKSTLTNMLIGYYKPKEGVIAIDGKSLNEFTMKSIRGNIGVVRQEIFLFDGTIRDNITIGRNKASEEEIISACKLAELWDFIETFPQKLDTIIGNNGISISGGQKQRIAIARIYLKDPKIIIFDEATASLDSETERNIHSSWEQVLANRTSIIIAHRLSSVLMCDRVLLIDKGQIIANGKPREMMEKNYEFKKLFSIKE